MAVIGHRRERPDWWARAACRGLDPAWFHPDRDDDPSAALDVCASCPVRLSCLEHALAHEERFGIWGGCTPGERRRIQRRRRATA